MLPRIGSKQTFLSISVVLLTITWGAILSQDARAGHIPVEETGPYCNTPFMQAFGFGPYGQAEAEHAASICSRESGGSRLIVNDSCMTGKVPGGAQPELSVGLFQINILAHHPGTICNLGKTLGEQPQATQDLVTFYQNPRNNAAKAAEIFAGNPNNWCNWTTAGGCALDLCPISTHPVHALSCSLAGGGGGPEGGIGDIPGIGNLKLEVQWPSIPIPGVGQKTLNELVEGDVQIHLGDLVRFLYAASLWIAGIIALIALVYAGLMYLISGQSPVMRSRARDRVVGVLTGAAILFAAVIFLNVLNPDFTNLSLELDRQFETRDTPGAPTEEGTIDTTGKYAPIPFASRSTTQTLYPDCSSAGITSDESQACLTIAGAIIVDEPSDDTQVSCAAVCMLLAGDSADCKSQRGTVDGLTPPSLKHDILHAWNVISGADGGEGWTPDSVTGIYGNTNSPDNEDFADHFEDLIRDVVDNSAGRVCVASYVDVAADAPGGWTWDACFCK